MASTWKSQCSRKLLTLLVLHFLGSLVFERLKKPMFNKVSEPQKILELAFVLHKKAIEFGSIGILAHSGIVEHIIRETIFVMIYPRRLVPYDKAHGHLFSLKLYFGDRPRSSIHHWYGIGVLEVKRKRSFSSFD